MLGLLVALPAAALALPRDDAPAKHDPAPAPKPVVRSSPVPVRSPGGTAVTVVNRDVTSGALSLAGVFPAPGESTRALTTSGLTLAGLFPSAPTTARAITTAAFVLKGNF